MKKIFGHLTPRSKALVLLFLLQALLDCCSIVVTQSFLPTNRLPPVVKPIHSQSPLSMILLSPLLESLPVAQLPIPLLIAFLTPLLLFVALTLAL